MSSLRQDRLHLQTLKPKTNDNEAFSSFIPFQNEPIKKMNYIDRLDEVSIEDKMAHHIRLAVIESNSTHLKNNPKLIHAVKMAKKNHLTPEEINRVIKGCKPNRNLKNSYILQIRYKRNIYVIITVFTNELLMLKRRMYEIMKKYNATFAYVMQMFNSCGIIEAVMSYRTAVEFSNIEGALNQDAIRCRATNVEVVDYATGAVNFKCSPLKLAEVSEAIQERSYKILHCDYGFQPKNLVELEGSECKEYNNFLLRLRQFPEVDKIFDNVRQTEEND